MSQPLRLPQTAAEREWDEVLDLARQVGQAIDHGEVKITIQDGRPIQFTDTRQSRDFGRRRR
ncbi:MAG TPA: DUF2292 domain-containing protein [Gemmatimonadales bacterium]|nr:DUF2292 domain-containing protein [Gemmatimonadales bacterium]